jgi:hypothetical protein
MVAVIAIVVAITVILLLGIPWLLKATVDMEKDSHDHLLDPGTAKVAYSVPSGVDAAVVCTALTAAGFKTTVSLVGGDELVLVEIHPGDRERVRSAIEGIFQREYGTSGLTLEAVAFADER